MKKSKKKSKKYGVGGSSNPLKDLNDMQALKRGQAYGSILEGGGIKYKYQPGGQNNKKLTTGESIQNEGYKKIIGALHNNLKKGWKQFTNYSNSDLNPLQPTESVFKKLYSQDKNNKTRSL